jgi:hypothetical protein
MAVRRLLIIGLSKTDYGGLIPLWDARGVAGQRVTAATWYTARFQPPIGCDPRVYLNYAAAFDAQLFGLGVPTEAALQRIYWQQFDRFDVFAGARRYPAPVDMLAAIQADTVMHPESRAALESRYVRIASVLEAAQRVTRVGATLDDLFNPNTVLELGSLPEDAQKYMLMPQLNGLFQQAIAAPLPADERRLLVLDDAQPLLAMDTALRARGLVGMDQRIGTLREALKVVICVQTIQKDVSAHVLANTRMKVLCQTNIDKDRVQLAADLHCAPDEAAWTATGLEPGVVAMNLGAGRCRRPFIYRYPRVELSAAPAPTIPQLPPAVVHETATEYATWRPYAPKPAQAASTREKPAVSDAEVRLLRAVVKEPGLKFTAYPVPTRAGMGMTQAARAREALKAKGLVTVEEEATGARGAPALVLRPTREGVAFLARVEGRIR